MKYNPYPRYKFSGVEWLCDVPEHWEVNRLKYNFQLLTEKTENRTKAIALENIESWTGRFIETETEFDGDGVAFVKDDILFGKLRPYLAKVLKADSSGEAVGDFFVLRPQKTIDSNFAAYYLRSEDFIDIIDGATFGSKMPRVSWDFMGYVNIPLPPLPEQQAIAAFLDRETGRIDTLVAKKKRLVELLREKRTALISRVVTKGLDLTVKMKPSGVEWLGDVPEHWEMKPLRYLFENLDSKRIPLSSEERGGLEKIYPYYGASGIIDFVDNYIYDSTLILVAEDGANLLSRSTPLAFRAEGKYWVNNHAHILRPKYDALSYWESLLQIFDYTPHISGSAQPKLTAENLGSIVLPLPPLPEQQAIAAFLDRETGKIDALIAKVETAIEKLKEYRGALISAAVTGKIDVRKC